MVKNDSNCIFPRLTLHTCALTRTISLSYRGILLSFHLVTMLCHLVTLFHFPMRFQLNSDFSHTFFNVATYAPYLLHSKLCDNFLENFFFFKSLKVVVSGHHGSENSLLYAIKKIGLSFLVDECFLSLAKSPTEAITIGKLSNSIFATG